MPDISSQPAIRVVNKIRKRIRIQKSLYCVYQRTTLDGFFRGFNAISIKIFFEPHNFLV